MAASQPEFRELLLSYTTDNLGDDIQSLAARPFLRRLDGYLDREFPEFNPIEKKHSAFFFSNGWFSHLPTSLDVPSNLTPFYIAFHVADPALLTPKNISHLKKNCPIGCRDSATVELLRAKGIDAYFSGCLTTTFDTHEGARSGVTICDLQAGLEGLVPKALAENAIRVTAEWKDPTFCILNDIGGRRFFSTWLRLRRRYSFPGFTTRAIFPYVQSRLGLRDPQRLERRFVAAAALLNRYRTSELVITSRFHATLPCLAFGTPVIFLHPNPQDRRFSGWENVFKLIGPGQSPINWHPKIPDISRIKNALKNICRAAEAVKGNPLRGESGKPLLKELAEAYAERAKIGGARIIE